jgi:dTDP-glucose pyrophosphorylase
MIIKYKNFKKNLVIEDTDIFTAIKIINNNNLKFLLILNKIQKLVGTITDGDLRRAIIKKIDLKSKIKFIMNKNYIYSDKKISNNFGLLTLKKEMVEFLPIIDKNKKIEYLIIPDPILNIKNISNNVLFIAGGKGSRLMPLTRNTPKPLLKIGSHSIIEGLITKFIFQGFKNFIISVNYHSNQFIEKFGNGNKFQCKIDYLKESKPLGTAGPLMLLKKKHFKNGPVIVANADLITNVNFNELLNFHNKNKNDLTVCIKNLAIDLPYGEVIFKNNRVFKILEKPNKSYSINIGIYVVSFTILKKFKKDHLNMNDFINIAISKKFKIKPFPVYENWQDIGNKFDFYNLKTKNHEYL